MAKLLWLLRHGEAVPHGSRPDHDRELTPRGEHQARTAGRALALLSAEFAACYASPKERARATAALACDELGVGLTEVSAVAGGFDREAVEDLLIRHDDGEAILVVGHEPDFSQVVHDYTGARVHLEKGGAAAVRVDGSASELVSLLRPAELETMAG